MDDHLRQHIAAWLEYYRELGIEDFYRRDPRSKLETGNSKIENYKGSDLAAAFAQPAESRIPNPESRVTTPDSRLPTPEPLVPSPQPRVPSLQPRAAASSLSLFEAPEPARGPETLEQIRADLGDCHRCKLANGRKKIVFGQGDPHADLVFVGEGPGADEDEQGLPFVGRAGQLLNRMIQFVGMKREEVYICNIVKCRPPGNRTPEKDEIDTCSPFLFRQLEAIKPRLICCLGAPAMKTLLGIKEGITRVRGQFFDFANTRAFVAYHPAYILRNPREEKILRADFETIRDYLKSPR